MKVTPGSQIEPGFSLLRSLCFLHTLLLFSRLKCINDTNWHITRRNLTSRGAESKDTDGDYIPGQEANSKSLEVALGCKMDKSIETRNSAGAAQAGVPGQCLSHISGLCGNVEMLDESRVWEEGLVLTPSLRAHRCGEVVETGVWRVWPPWICS